VPPGAPAADIGEIMNRADSIAQTVALLTKSIQTQLIEAGTLKDIHRTIASAAEVSAQLHGVIAEQNRNLTAMTAEFRQDANRLSHIVDSAQVTATIASARATIDNANRFVSHLDSTNAQIQHLVALAERGNGTVGKLLTDTLLYSDLRHTVQQMDSLMADFKANPRKYINLRIF
jgi:phospholipid/cholesterol/gamma-HCH transport system substrate-binding protein